MQASKSKRETNLPSTSRSGRPNIKTGPFIETVSLEERWMSHKHPFSWHRLPNRVNAVAMGVNVIPPRLHRVPIATQNETSPLSSTERGLYFF